MRATGPAPLPTSAKIGLGPLHISEVDPKFAWVWRDPSLIVCLPFDNKNVGEFMPIRAFGNASSGVTAPTAPYIQPWGRMGRALQWTTTGGTVGGYLAVDGVISFPGNGDRTIILPYRKTDSTLRQSCAFSNDFVLGGNVPRFLNARIPYSDGNVYWAFGGATAPNVVVVSGLTFGTDVWAFTGGSQGMSVWQNGKRVGGHSTPVTRTVAGGWRLGRPNQEGFTPDWGNDLGQYWAPLWVFARILSGAEIIQLSMDPWGPLRSAELF